MANVIADNQARATVFCVISSAMIGLMEVLTIVGALLTVAPEDMGLANGVEFTLRGVSTCICGEYTLESPEPHRTHFLMAFAASVYTTIVSRVLGYRYRYNPSVLT